ncbi:MAG: adenine deaminase [Deltaproteobacteria bacterium]|nr:adenine deaminase [Deltaproteobacteria bacterium]MBM4324711.1 adenine deaminase [Deltaproteobacteria bacterium]
MASLEERIKVASGEGKADLLIKNGRILNVFTGEIEKKDVAVFKGIIIGFNDYPAKKTIDLKGDFLCPGLIDGHVHIESSMVTIPQFARAVLPNGTTSVVIDPHEIANVLGLDGIRFMAESAKGVPLNVFIMVPSCVPATHMETSGAILNSNDITPLLNEPWAIGLAEMMNFPGVIYRNPEVLKKIEMAVGKRIDGHAPALSGKSLYAYLTAGIRSDHECTTPKEAKEKLKNGMWIMVREGSTAKNLKDLLPLVDSKNSRRFLFVTDDRHPKELIEEGHINSMIKQAIRLGLDPILAIQMATINAAEYFRLDNLGAIAPGFRADFVSFDHLGRFEIKKVFKDGILVAENGKIPSRSIKPFPLFNSKEKQELRIKPIAEDSFVLKSDQPLVKVIQIIPDQIITKKTLKNIILREGVACPDLRQDILKILVVERHHATGNIGIGFVQGFGLKKGAIGSTVAHDSHNLVIVGTNDQDMLKVVETIKKMGGGLAVVSEGKVMADLPLPIAGLMAEVSVPEVHRSLEKLHRAAKSLGCQLSDPFITLSFLSLPVIPELKITDKGLVDVNQFKIVPVFGEE